MHCVFVKMSSHLSSSMQHSMLASAVPTFFHEQGVGGLDL
jgi:hypothetical protein